MRSQRKRCDRLFSQLVRTQVGECERCGRQPPDVQLQVAHWVSRRYSATRTWRDNAFCLCAACHRWFTDQPVEFARWSLERRGAHTYQTVFERSCRRGRFNWDTEAERLTALVDKQTVKG